MTAATSSSGTRGRAPERDIPSPTSSQSCPSDSAPGRDKRKTVEQPAALSQISWSVLLMIPFVVAFIKQCLGHEEQ